MPIPPSGPVSFGQIQTEYGGTNPISIDEYYRGGVNVPAVSTTTTIPSSGAISLNDFHNTSKSVSPPPYLTVSISPTVASGTSGAGICTSNNVTAGASGGTGPYTYSWTYVSGTTMTLSSTTAATINFSHLVSSGTPNVGATYRCTVTDSLGNTGSDTVDVDLNFDNGA